MTNEQWHAESAAVFKSPPFMEQPVGLCGVCKAPVLSSHAPVGIEWAGTGELGFIHGAFDCTDQPRCDGKVEISGGGGMTTTARCVLPANHVDAVGHLGGEPS